MRVQLKGRCSNHTQNTFGPNEQITQVESGVVLAQAAQPIPHVAIGRDDLQAERLRSGIAVAQDGSTASVGGQVAPNRAATLCSERQREEPISRASFDLQRFQQNPRLDRDRVANKVPNADAVQAFRRQDDLCAARVGGGTARQPGISSLSDDAQAVPCRDLNGLRDLVGRRWSHDSQRRTSVFVAPVHGIGLHVVGLRQNVVTAQALGELAKRGVAVHHVAPCLNP